MKNLLCLVAFLAACGASIAQPPPKAAYPEARRLYEEFEKTLRDSMLWEKKSLPARMAAVKAATAHQGRVNKMWGDGSQCAGAAAAHVDFVISLNRIAAAGDGTSRQNPFDLLGAMNNAERFGNHRAACYEAVEELDQVAKR
jgi:hypothetical protein